MIKEHTITEWTIFFGIEIVDWDGFRGMKIHVPISLDVFAKEICECTIKIVDSEKYENFKFLLNF